ncbi:double-strand break repair helicase AddA [uncultured Algimonas sp.]|uniref:double-strand break repair helicase AddA n=1 Tax=uncultured Algimonas sp. TaxID=1547920 RepID=UPI00262D7B1F|nr:double-strand break repair helicase AddA [uncultured Algimonas sp.]
MSRPTLNMTLEEATRLQRIAADPSAPRMVNANAGSGKTKVLVDRVSRILLQGTDPDKILCLTYTRAAASEMQERLFDKFSEWSIAPDAVLKAALGELHGMPYPDVRPALDIDRVRTLFARALETPEGLKVMTIHAFCERIIARFPIEAGIMPGFSPLDDADGREMLAESRMRLLERAREDDGLSAALHRLTRLKADSTLDDLLYGVARDFDRTKAWQRSGGLSNFRRRAGLEESDTEESLSAFAWTGMDHDHLALYAEEAIDAGGHAKKFGEAIQAALLADDPVTAFALYSQPFFTQKGTLTSQLPAKGFQERDPFIGPDSPEQRRVARMRALLQAARLADRTEAVLSLGYALGADHARAKHQARGLDFNDLIVKTRDLLRRKDVSDWIAYKLDGGVEHVLLDEAQDTSPTQWEIIDAVTAPFAHDAPDRDAPPRTFFAVGDPKQSIYRFQGAAPSIFTESIRTRGGEEGEVRLRMSFRSAQDVLDVVDALFVDQGGIQAMFDAHIVPDAADPVRHVAHRDDAGLVELWPLAPRAEPLEDKAPWDTTPVDQRSDGDPRIVLARTIAEQIAHWLERAEPVFDRKAGTHRPMHAGDILILVQKRVGGLFDALIKALKEEGLPVAGADRLVLQDATIVRDLLAITRFVLLPGDCLSLAEALKSPLFGLTDDQLFALCVDRGDMTLWQAVQARAPQLATHLQAMRNDAALAPYDFYARLLDRRNPAGSTYREALFRRLGMEANEALEAFLATALSHQQRQAPGLQRFLQAFTADEIEIKRDKDPAGGEIRVMTVHGAKGLEAPVVFLPDTTRVPTARSGGLIPDGEDGFILAPSQAESFDLADTLKREDHAEAMREYMRLLYVAMTRAESRLVLCGHAHGKAEEGFAEGSWYHWFLRTLPHLDGVTAFATAFDGEGRQGLRYGRRPDRAETHASDPVGVAALPDWIDVPAAPERRITQTATPSALLDRAEPMGRGPGGGRFLRGILIHKLLEMLPDHPPARRPDLAAKIVGDYPDFVQSEREAILREVFGVLDDPDFADVFAEGSRAEVSLAGRVETIRGGDVFLTAQVDRLHVTTDTVYLVDYKSNPSPPDHADDVDDAYLAQMAAYRELARAIWPDRHVRCGLLWTDAPSLMWLPDDVMDAVLTQVNGLPTSGPTEERGPS